MPKFLVYVERVYKARHVHEVTVEAEDEEAANNMVEDMLESGECDPSGEGTYTDTNEAEGYDDAGAWEVDGEHTEEVAD